MLKKDSAIELFKKGKELKELGYQLEDYREKLNALSEELSLSDPIMLEMEGQFDELLMAYMKKDSEAKSIVQESCI